MGAQPVVLVHGLGVSSRYFVPTQTRLAQRFRVYAVDLPGFGKSESPARPLDIPGLASALAGWMQANGLTRAAFVGNSMGCQVIACLAMCRPELVERAVLSAPTMDPHARGAVRQLLRLLVAAPRERPVLLLLVACDYVKSGVIRTAITFRHALSDRIETRLPHLPMPVMVVRGARDPIVSQRWVEEAAALLPDGRLRVLSGSAHAAHFSTPAAFTGAIGPFLLDCDAGCGTRDAATSNASASPETVVARSLP
ncbi:MAG TPA: alpha/beta hydrolase [Thermomicrobiales bacterium]|nr:alpha/beta hydrolase [Thermomicrobiales bacterium]